MLQPQIESRKGGKRNINHTKKGKNCYVKNMNLKNGKCKNEEKCLTKPEQKCISVESNYLTEKKVKSV